MAGYTTYGPWTSSGNRAMRLRHDITVGTPAVGASTVAVTVTTSVEARYSFWDSAATFTRQGAMGSASRSVSVSVGTNSSAVIDRASSNLPIYASGAYTVAVATSLSGVDYVGATASHSTEFPLPGRVSGLPGRPAPTATYRKDTEALISWGVTDLADRYYVEQWAENLGRWTRLGTVYGTSLIDYGLSPNSRYKWRVCAANGGYESAWAETGGIRTTPSAPRLEASRLGQAIQVHLTAAASYPQHWYLERRIDGGSWQYWTQSDGADGVASMTPSPGQIVQIRGRSGVSEGGQRWSAWTTTAVIPALTPPNAPTLLAPAGTASTDDPIVLVWRHEPRDLTGQSAAEVRWRPAGTSEWTTRSVGTEQRLSAPLTTGLWEWQARTKGQHADYGPWSAAQGFRVAPPPVVQLTAPTPGQELATNRAAFTAAFTDGQGVAAAWRALLLDADGATLETLSGSGHPGSRRFTSVLANLTEYQIQVTITSSTGLSATAGPVRISTRFSLPATPTVRAEFVDAEGIVRITTARGEDPTAPATTGLHVEVSRDGGATWQPLAVAPLPSGEVTDPLPILGGEMTYRAVASSDLPSEAASEVVTVGTHTVRAWATGDDGATAYLVLDMSLQASHGHDVVLAEYEGDPFPTPHFGERRPEQLQFSGILTARHGSSRADWLRMLGQRLWWRDPTGLRWRGVIAGGGFSLKRRRGSPAVEIAGTVVRVSE